MPFRLVNFAGVADLIREERNLDSTVSLLFVLRPTRRGHPGGIRPTCLQPPFALRPGSQRPEHGRRRRYLL